MMGMKNSASQVNPQWKASPASPENVENSQGWKHRNWITHQKSVRSLNYKESWLGNGGAVGHPGKT